MRLTVTSGALAVVVALSVLGGCKKAMKVSAEAIENSPAAITQKGAHGTSTWIVGPDGAVSALLKGPDKKPISGKVTGSINFAIPDGTPTSVPATYDPGTGVLTAAGPKLDADITPVNYQLQVDGNPWDGSIDVPRGGTQDLVETGGLQAQLPPGRLGPNGGVVQMVGPDRVEVVANKKTGDVRAYVLDPDYHVIDPGDRRITLGLEGPEPEVVVLAPQPHARFVVGHMRSRVDPVHVTVAVNEHGRTHACLVGWHPGVAVVYGPAVVPVPLYAVDTWHDDDGEVEFHGRHGEVVVGAPGVVVGGPEVVVGAPGVVVGAPGVVVGAPGVVVGAPGAVIVGGERGEFHGGRGEFHGHFDRGRHGR